MTYFLFIENSFFWKLPHFFPHWNFPLKVHTISIGINNPPLTELGLQWQYLQKISSFDCHPIFSKWNLPTTSPKQYTQFQQVLKNLPTWPFPLFINNLYFWWQYHLSNIKLSQQKPEKGNANFNRSCETFLTGIFPVHKKFAIFTKALQKRNKISTSSPPSLPPRPPFILRTLHKDR